MKIIRRILITVVGLVLVIAILLGAAGLWLPPRSFPQIDGQVQLTGLETPTDVYRDVYGIPHIYATTSHDLFFAQGYVHAQDRFWQMDFWRHLGAGRLSEMFGKSQLDTDKFLRTLGWSRIAQQEWQAMGVEEKAILQAYADGVNAYLAGHQGISLSLEYAVLKLLNPGYRPEPWQPVNTLTWAKVMAWDLGGNMNSEIQRSILQKSLTPAQIDDLFPPYPSDNPLVAAEFQHSKTTLAQNGLPAGLYTELAPAFQSLADRLASLDLVLGPRSDGIGSNDWVIGGSRTATGKPILADDMHLGEQIPAIWYEVDLHCTPKGPDCPFQVSGFSFAGVPGVIVGHTDRIAWGFTNVGPDVQDLYVEKINPSNPNQYEYDGQWVDMQVIEETIQVADGDPMPLTVRLTRHGPVISEVYGRLKDFSSQAAWELPTNYAISLRWTALEPNQMVNAIMGFNRATNWDEFRQAARDFAAPSQNIVFADVDGNIAYQTPGRIPIRTASVDGQLPVPGWSSQYDWQGYIPFEELPTEFNPGRGYVASANNAVVGPDYPYLIAKTWNYGFRARRIVEMIEQAPTPITLEYVNSMHGDNKDLNAEVLVPILMRVNLDDAHLETVRSVLQDWDYQDDMRLAAPALFNVFWKHLLADTFRDDLPESYWPTGGSQWFEVVRHLVQQPDSPWWDDQGTPEKEGRDQIFRKAFQDAVTELEAALGKEPARWTWGDLHTITFHNPTLGLSGIKPVEALFNRGPYRVSGGSDTVNNTAWNAAKDDYATISMPSERLIVDLSNLDNSLSVITTGESGHAFQKHYADMAELWRQIQYHPMLWDPARVQAGAEGHLRLVP